MYYGCTTSKGKTAVTISRQIEKQFDVGLQYNLKNTNYIGCCLMTLCYHLSVGDSKCQIRLTIPKTRYTEVKNLAP